MDGFGLAEPGPGNAISQARTPCLDEVFATRPWTKLEASGEAVGLPAGQMGNSEVGHLNIGAGRVVFQELTRINRACADGSLAANPVLNEAFAAAARPGAALHLMGLVSDGGVHSSNEHLYALARAAKAAGASHIVVHCFMDGRDVPPKSGAGYLDELEGVLAELTDEGCAAEIGSISGRYYAMDRDNRWERVEQAWRAVVAAEPRADATAAEVMAASYAADVTDEFVVPTALTGRGARGGDAAAHAAALEEGGRTVAFLGGGCDRLYPAEHEGLFQRIVDGGGAVVSEHVWDEDPKPYRFRLRNRLIAGLARATLIVEAGLPSGTFSTADEALAANRDVLVVPGAITAASSRGANRLIYQGATPVIDDETFEDALFSLFGCLKQETVPSVELTVALRADEPSNPVADALRAEPLSMEQLYAIAASSCGGEDARSWLMERLVEAELAGAVARHPDGRWGPAVR